MSTLTLESTVQNDHTKEEKANKWESQNTFVRQIFEFFFNEKDKPEKKKIFVCSFYFLCVKVFECVVQADSLPLNNQNMQSGGKLKEIVCEIKVLLCVKP